ncbi:cell division protein ZapA [Thalassotalea agarivorans]|uniref:Cell division protein ZapA n=1 Tax=Thalassotalea agarivorans TaxID=349064 RepID=A0A1I0HFL1_THASX|nr:cell division protein ZapA [Thalassotalea agarivorans]SET82637.1 cell division protein ZapA [Thalassotalea agarivorans]
MDNRSVEIQLANRKMKVACPLGQESALLNAAELVNEQFKKQQSLAAINATEQAALMVALNLANELHEVKQQLVAEQKTNQNKIALLQATIENALNQKTGS